MDKVLLEFEACHLGHRDIEYNTSRRVRIISLKKTGGTAERGHFKSLGSEEA